jgi:biotin operon repressor
VNYSSADMVHVRLEWGRPQTIADLSAKTLLSIREVQAAVEELRRRGVPIVTGSKGVWLTTSPDELLDSYRRLRRRALRQLANLRQMQRTAAAMRGVEQTTIWDQVA